MTLKIQTEQDDQRQLLMTIEVPEERVEKQMRKTARKLSHELNIPGFRKGKVPYPVLLKRLGRDALRSEAVEEMLKPLFTEALDEVEPDIYAPANFDDMEMEPLVLKFTVPLTPEVTLGDYRELRKEIEAVEISEEAVEEALQKIQAQHQELEEVERPVELNDMVTLSGKGELLPLEEDAETEAAASDSDDSETEAEHPEDNIIFDSESVDLIMDSEQIFWGEEFVNNIVGMATGDEKTFTITFANDLEEKDLAGRQATFTLTVLNVQSRILPELDDELAELEGTFETIEELRQSVHDDLKTNAENEAKNELIEGMLDDLLKGATLVYPPAAVESEIDGMIENFKNQVTRSGWSWEDFLQLQNNQEEELRENFRENATTQLERQLALRQFIFDEKLRVTEAEIDAIIDERVSRFGDDETLLEGMRDHYRSGPAFEMISSEVLMDNAYMRIEAVLTGNAPDLAELEAAEKAAAEVAAKAAAEEKEADESATEPSEEDETPAQNDATPASGAAPAALEESDEAESKEVEEE
ncbi:Cell division trigger factor [hydrothermal vent metagenome]|uniref:peptidylprolyl isomerase n=1 Tax=hydrothermal vent metagenome TaxID=652676 RepID=A0A3B0UUN1_9ZZZZ